MMRSYRSLLLLLLLTLGGVAVLANAIEDSAHECDINDASETCTSAGNATESSDSAKECVDDHDLCEVLAYAGDCIRNPTKMLKECPKSCSVCGFEDPETIWDNVPCVDLADARTCDVLLRNNKCDQEPDNALVNCRQTCRACNSSIIDSDDFGVKQIEGGDKPHHTAAIIRESKKYVREIMLDTSSSFVREFCRNTNAMCSVWAAEGKCSENPAMRINCAAACQTCDRIDIRKACPGPYSPDVVTKNQFGVNSIFERIVDKFPQYNPIARYRPYSNTGPRGTIGNGPWLLSFDKFLSDEETDRLIAHGKRAGYGRKEEVEVRFQPTGTYRFIRRSSQTPSFAWCDDECEQDPIVQGILDRVATMTGVPKDNAEPLEILKFEKGDYEGLHNDYLDTHYQKDRLCGPRTLTFYFALNDEDVVGGEFHMKKWHAQQFKLERGKAYLWANVENHDVQAIGDRPDHETLPVRSGTKYSAHMYLHLRDFKHQFEEPCVPLSSLR